ncbi:hypothetical protein [Lysobacter gummosus]|uniref:hypothetical protein n=1 Tax=Lysobacter gummosus TaxID=262324 RepID=UPI003636FA9B
MAWAEPCTRGNFSSSLRPLSSPVAIAASTRCESGSQALARPFSIRYRITNTEPAGAALTSDSPCAPIARWASAGESTM